MSLCLSDPRPPLSRGWTLEKEEEEEVRQPSTKRGRPHNGNIVIATNKTQISLRLSLFLSSFCCFETPVGLGTFAGNDGDFCVSNFYYFYDSHFANLLGENKTPGVEIKDALVFIHFPFPFS